MTKILQGHVSANGTARNITVTYHLEGCGPCEKTLGSFLRELQAPDSAQVAYGFPMTELLVNNETSTTAPVCQRSGYCAVQAFDVLRQNVDDLHSFPVITVMNATDVIDVTNEKCFYDLRAEQPEGCLQRSPENCDLSAARRAWCQAYQLAFPGEPLLEKTCQFPYDPSSCVGYDPR